MEVVGAMAINLMTAGLVIAQPTIFQQPQPVTVTPGASAQLGVVATSTGTLTYQWIKDGHLLSGETNANLNLTAVGFSDVGLYRVVVQDPTGMVNSRSVRLKTDPFGSSFVAWGSGDIAALMPPSDLHDAVQVGVGLSHVTVLREDSTVMVWGQASDPVLEVPEGLTNVVAIAAGGRHSLALKEDGKVVAWGVTADGRTDVPAGLSNVVDIAAGYEFSAALKSDGRVVVWGSDYWAQRRVPAALTNAVSIAAASLGNHTVALRSDGTVLSWGFHYYGATNVPSGLEGAVAIAAGGDFGLALKNDDTLAGWGNNDEGQRTFPAGLSNSVSIVGGQDHSLALSDAGQLTAWGYKFGGVTNVPPIGDPVVSYSAGRNFTVVLHSLEPAAFIVEPFGATVQVGEDVVLSATAVGVAPLVFRWYRDGVLLPGETNIVLSLTAVAPNAAGRYTVSVSNVVNSVVSAPAVVTVNRLSQSIDFGALPALATTNAPLQLIASASSGLPVSFQGSDDAIATVSGDELTVAGPGTLMITATQPGDATYLPASPVTRELKVYAPLGVVAAPESQVAAVGAGATFAVTVNGSGPIGYRWFFRVSEEAAEVSLPGATNRTLILEGLTTNQAGLYSVEVENPLGSLRSPAGVLTVEQLSQMITFSPLADRLTTDADFILGGYASSGLPVEYQSSDPSVASVNGATVSIHGPGSTVITARQPGDASYSPAAEVSRGLQVNEPVAIVSSPQNQTVVVGSNVVFSVGVSGSGPFSHQWRYRASDGEPLDPIPGETNASLTLSNVATNASGIYAVTVTGPANSETAQASLTVNRRAQTIVFEEIPVQSSDAGPRTLTATASSGLQVDYVSGNTAVATVEGASLRIVGPGVATITANRAGDSTYLPADPVTRTLTVIEPVSIVTRPVTQTVAVGSNVVFSVEAVGGGELFYRWSHQPEGQTSGGYLPGETNATLRLDNVTTNMAGFYGVVVYNEVSSKGVGERLTVLEPVAILQGPTNQVVAVGSNVVFGVEAVGGGELSYQWSVRPAEDASFVDLIGETNATLTLTNVTTNVSGFYSVQVNNPVSSNIVSGELTVIEPVSIVTRPVTQTVAVGSNVVFSVEAAGGGELFYRWSHQPEGQTSGGYLPGETNATLRLDNVTTNMAGFYGVVVYNEVSSKGVGERLTVNRRTQSIEFDIPSVRLDTDGPSWLGGRSDSGLLVSYSSSNPSVARIEDDVLIITGAGSTTITASQAGDAVYLPADSVPRPLTVLRRVTIGERANAGRDVKLQGFRLLVSGNPNREVVIEYKNSLSDTKWAPLKTNMLGQVDVEFIDLSSTNRTRRFYRVIER
jgi:hypothetical protein